MPLVCVVAALHIVVEFIDRLSHSFALFLRSFRSILDVIDKGMDHAELVETASNTCRRLPGPQLFLLASSSSAYHLTKLPCVGNRISSMP